jgi:hypothetical protein
VAETRVGWYLWLMGAPKNILTPVTLSEFEIQANFNSMIPNQN